MHEATQNTAKAIFGQLVALGVDVHIHQMPARHRYDDCNYSCHTIDDVDAFASCTVYPAEGPSADCCLACTVPAADTAIVESNGRADQCTVDVATTDAAAARELLRAATRETYAATFAAADRVRQLLRTNDLVGATR